MTVADSPLPAADSSVEVVAVINSFDRLPLLQEALGALTNALREADIPPAAIVVYEAGSTDGSREFLASWRGEHPDDRLEIVLPVPGAGTSFSDGVNAGCAAALQRFPATRYLLLYESDNWIAGSEPLRQARALLEARPELATVGWTLRKHTGRGGVGYGMCFPTLLAFAAGSQLSLLLNLDGPNTDDWQKTGDITWRACDVLFTSPLLIRRAVWDQSGGFDARAFPFGDCDLDWAWRVRKLGLGTQGVIQSDAVVHDNRAQASAWSDNRVLDFHRARMRLLRRHRGRWVGMIKPLLFARHAGEIALLLLVGWSRPNAKTRLAKRVGMLGSVWRDYLPAGGEVTPRATAKLPAG